MPTRYSVTVIAPQHGMGANLSNSSNIPALSERVRMFPPGVMIMTMFTGHQYITDMSETLPFDQYLLIESDYGHSIEAYGFDDNEPMDLDAMLSEVYSDFNVSTYPQNGGTNYAAIITDNRSPDSGVVWTSCDFYLD